MQRTISLLEQFVLYNKPDYRPFHSRPKPDDATLAESNSENENQPVQLSFARSNGTSDTNTVSTPLLLSIDLNFDIPIPEGQSIINPTTPLSKSTSRRSDHCRLRSSCRCCSCKGLTGLRRSTKPKTMTKRVQHKQARMPAASQMQHDFLSLPGEVRDLIYTYLFAQARLHVTQKSGSLHRFDLHHSIRLTCQNMYLETARPFFDSLSVTLNADDFKTGAFKPINNTIPEHIRTKLQHLTIITPNLHKEAVDFDRIELGEMPFLRHLRLVEFEFVPEVLNGPPCAISLGNAVANVQSMFQPSKLEQQHWFNRLFYREGRHYKMTYEAEVYCSIKKDRGAHMGMLKKILYLAYVISCSQDNKEKLWATRLAPAQLRQKYDIYCRMEKNRDQVIDGSHALNVLRRLEEMKYHETLNNIEAAAAKIANELKI